jgi:hypothetical protein
MPVAFRDRVNHRSEDVNPFVDGERGTAAQVQEVVARDLIVMREDGRWKIGPRIRHHVDAVVGELSAAEREQTKPRRQKITELDVQVRSIGQDVEDLSGDAVRVRTLDQTVTIFG